MKGEKVTPGAPPDQLFDKARKALTLMGHEGIAMIAVSGFDMACWDAYAQAQGQPLVEALGGKAAPVTANNSCGLGIIEAKAATEEAKKLLAEGGYGAAKVRLGRETLDKDLAVLGAVRDAVGADVILPVDFNQCLSVDDAIERGRALDQENVYWIEEPTRYNDWQGNARIAAAVETPAQNGENFYGPEGAAQAIEAKALDYLMPDVERIGGVTGWMRAARIAKEVKTRCRCTCSRNFRRTFWRRRRWRTGWNSPTGRCRCLKIRSPLPTATSTSPTPPAPASRGTRTRWKNIPSRYKTPKNTPENI